MVCSEILDNESKETAAGFWECANAFYASLSITVLPDNGSCYRSRVLTMRSGHKISRPYRPQTNRKVFEEQPLVFQPPAPAIAGTVLPGRTHPGGRAGVRGGAS